MKSLVNEMSFTARRALEEAMTEDCKKSQGECMGASAKEIHCEEIKAEGSEEGKGETKDKGKDKKKK